MSRIKMLLIGTLFVAAVCLISCDVLTKPVQEDDRAIKSMVADDNDVAEITEPNTEETIATENFAILASEKPPWFDAYNAVLNGDNELDTDFMNLYVIDEVNISNTKAYRGCGLYDADGDGMPELFVMIGLWEGMYQCLFTYENNAGTYIGDIHAGAVEKSTGILINACDEAGYTPDVAYTYKDGIIEELPGYVESVYEYEDNNLVARVKLGGNIYDWFSDDIVHIETFPNLEEALMFYNS